MVRAGAGAHGGLRPWPWGRPLATKDTSPDGWAVEAEPSTGRVASTRGHKGLYITVASGNPSEGHPYKLRECIVKNSERKWTPWHAA
ncbi:hypothetical protein [Streptomyces sp. NPDC001903]|uniref:hypothetical protein n=1 Tax=Streptomyces sp. NPDC001903 TaxID=3364622 RepID=UPI0036B615D0